MRRTKKRKQGFTRKWKVTFTELIFNIGHGKGKLAKCARALFPRVGKEHLHMSTKPSAQPGKRGEALEEVFQMTVSGSYHEEWEQ
jgi:hypothetical protein